MKIPKKCSECKLKLIRGLEKRGERIVRKVAMCPKCKVKYAGKDIEGYMEVEKECFALKFVWKNIYPEKEEILKVKKLDPDLQNQPMVYVYQQLKGLPYWQTENLDHFDASNLFEQAKELGLTVEWVYTKDDGFDYSSNKVIFVDDWE